LRSLCDDDHKDAHFVWGGLPPRTERGNPASRHDRRRQIGSLRKKESPALVSGAEDHDRSSFLPNQAIPIRAIGSPGELLAEMKERGE